MLCVLVLCVLALTPRSECEYEDAATEREDEEDEEEDDKDDEDDDDEEDKDGAVV